MLKENAVEMRNIYYILFTRFWDRKEKIISLFLKKESLKILILFIV